MCYGIGCATLQSVRNNRLFVREDKLFPSKPEYKNYLEMIGTNNLHVCTVHR